MYIYTYTYREIDLDTHVCVYIYIYIYIYIYTRISRALRARSILSDLDLEATSLAGRNWVCTPNLDPSTRLFKGWHYLSELDVGRMSNLPFGLV